MYFMFTSMQFTAVMTSPKIKRFIPSRCWCDWPTWDQTRDATWWRRAIYATEPPEWMQGPTEWIEPISARESAASSCGSEWDQLHPEWCSEWMCNNGRWCRSDLEWWTPSCSEAARDVSWHPRPSSSSPKFPEEPKSNFSKYSVIF